MLDNLFSFLLHNKKDVDGSLTDIIFVYYSIFKTNYCSFRCYK